MDGHMDGQGRLLRTPLGKPGVQKSFSSHNLPTAHGEKQVEKQHFAVDSIVSFSLTSKVLGSHVTNYIYIYREIRAIVSRDPVL